MYATVYSLTMLCCGVSECIKALIFLLLAIIID